MTYPALLPPRRSQIIGNAIPKPMSRIYYYILRYDDGFAPCVDRGALTLAICKPSIRRAAEEGDWLMGVSPKAHGHRLCYAAQVTEKIRGRKYYVARRFKNRGDRIYSFDGARFRLRNRSVHTEANTGTDVGRYPEYKNAVILGSGRGAFWYFGEKARDISRDQFPALNRRLDRLSQGHRVNHSNKVHRELEQIIRILKSEKRGVRGSPRDPPRQISHDAKCSKHHGVC
jgi:hypothetical protein